MEVKTLEKDVRVERKERRQKVGKQGRSTGRS